MSALFSPIRLRSLTLPNRIVVSPMCQYSAVDGCAQPWHTVHLGQLAIGGAGMLIVEATAVEPVGRITAGCLGLYDDATEAALTALARTLRQVSPIPLALQLGHAGRKASSGRPWEGGQLVPAAAGGWTPVGAVGDSTARARGAAARARPAPSSSGCARASSTPCSGPTAPASMRSRCTPRTATCCTSS